MHITNGIGRDFIDADRPSAIECLAAIKQCKSRKKQSAKNWGSLPNHVNLPNYLSINHGTILCWTPAKTRMRPSMSSRPNGAAYADL